MYDDNFGGYSWSILLHYNRDSQKSQIKVSALDKQCYLSVDSRYKLGNMLRFKMVVVGDAGVGKTTLLCAIEHKQFVGQLAPWFDVSSIFVNAKTPEGKPCSYGILQARKSTTLFAQSHILIQTFSLSAFPQWIQNPWRAFLKSGFQRSSIIAQGLPSFW